MPSGSLLCESMMTKNLIKILDQLPGMAKVAGRRCFREYIADPIPRHVHGIHGGYQSWTLSGHVLTFFDYDAPLDRNDLLAKWDLKSLDGVMPVMRAITRKHLDNISTGYTKPLSPSGGSSIWLLLDEEAGKDALYDATAFLLHPCYEMADDTNPQAQ